MTLVISAACFSVSENPVRFSIMVALHACGRCVALLLGALIFLLPPPCLAASLQGPEIDFTVPADGSSVAQLYSIEIVFDRPVVGVDAADLLINGSPAATVFEPAQSHFVFGFNQPASGKVEMRWALGHGIQDLEAKGFNPTPLQFNLDPGLASEGIQITEFMADNNRTINDEDGDSSDWVEIQNVGPSAVNLDGWSLTNIPGEARWKFPPYEIPSGGFLLVFASGKDRKDATRRLHTNFRLTASGGYLALQSPDLKVRSEFAPSYPPQKADVSYGRLRGETVGLGYFPVPTPGKPNTTGGLGFASEVTFSNTSGTFLSPFSLILTALGDGTLIRYTLDGTLPSEISTVYREPIAITNTVQVRARAYHSGILPGPPHSENFVMLGAGMTTVTSDLPVLVIHTINRATVAESKNTYVHYSLFEPVNGTSCLTNRPTFATRGAAKLRGSSTAGLPKSSFAVEWWDEYNQDDSKGILGMPAESEWVLYAPNEYDPVLIHNPFMHQLSRSTGRYSPRTRFVEVYYNKTGGALGTNNYNGIYVLEEKISIGKHRVDIDKLEPEHLAEPEITGGYLLKIDRLDPGDTGLGAGGVVMADIDPKERELKQPQRLAQRKYISDYFNNFSKALFSTTWTNAETGYAAYIDVQAWIDYHVLEVISGNVDSLVLSCYLRKPRNEKIMFGPHWDFDRALGSTDGRDSNPRQWQTGPFFSTAWWSRLFRDPDFWQRWVDRYQEYRTNQLSTVNANLLIDSLADEVRQAQPRDRKRWSRSMRGGSYQSEVNLMKSWLSNRLEFIDRQLAQPPRFDRPPGKLETGEKIALTLPILPTNSVVYYTTDGSDPRSFQGGIAPGAKRYEAPFAVDRTTRVIARAWNSSVKQSGGPVVVTPWSMSVEGVFSVNPPQLRVTEVMFHPNRSDSGTTVAPRAAQVEFLEILNQGKESVSLKGVRLTGDIEFVFGEVGQVQTLGPGQRLVVAKDEAAFRSRHPSVPLVTGNFAGSLAGAGRKLSIIGPLGEVITQIQLPDLRGSLADGAGFSAVPEDENPISGTESWRVSASEEGSPGTEDPKNNLVPTVWINEILSNPTGLDRDRVELFNPGNSAVNLSGWFLSDRLEDPRQFRITDGSVIPAGGYLSLEINPSKTGVTGAVGLSARGDELHLFSASVDGTLTGWHHLANFDATPEGISLGRVVTKDGREYFQPQVQTSFGAANAGVSLGNVLITEIHYRPPFTAEFPGHEGEFVELYNPGAKPVRLFDRQHPELAWKLRGSVEFDFPLGAIIPPNGFLVIRGPSTPGRVDAIVPWVQRYRFGGSVQVMGSWSGHLPDDTGTVRLLRPDTGGQPVVLNNVAYVPVDEVHYSASSPWPLAYGNGRSLSRVRFDQSSNEPGQWIAGIPSPGDLDQDGDGLTDRWEIARGLNPRSSEGTQGANGDPDNDGASNETEFSLGSALMRIGGGVGMRIEPLPGGGVWMQFNRPAGQRHVVQTTDRIDTVGWTDLLELPPSTVAESYEAILPEESAARFYRVQIR